MKKSQSSASDIGFEIYFGLLAVAVAIVAVVFALTYVLSENTIYTWDFRGYWAAYQDRAHALLVDPIYTLKQLRWQTRDSEYNDLFVLPLAPFEWIFGDSRATYVVAIALIFLVPAAFVSAAVGVRVTASSPAGSERLRFTAFVAAAILFPPFWAPALRGFPDVVGLVPLGLATLLVLNTDWVTKLKPGRSVLLGLCLWAPFLFRKWYAFALVVFITTSFAYLLVQCRTSYGGLDWRKARNLVLTFGIAGATSAIGAITAQSGLLLLAATTNYSALYTAYQLPFWQHFFRFFDHFGPLPLALAGFGVYTLGRRSDTFFLSIFLTLNAVFTYVFFAHTQAPDPHHMLPISYWLFVLACAGGNALMGEINPKLRLRALIAVGTVVVFLFAANFFPLPQPFQAAADILQPTTRRYPLRIDSPEGYQRLFSALSKLISDTDTLTVFAASPMDSRTPISDDVILAQRSDRLSRALTTSSDVDRRDGLPIEPLLSRYALVADPVQTHLPPETQQGILIPARSLLDHQGIGAAYSRRAEEFPLGRGVTVKIFEKLRPFTPDEVNGLLEDFYQKYPEWRADDAFARLLLLSDVRMGDGSTPMHMQTSRAFRIGPGRTTYTEVRFPASASPEALRFHLSLVPSCREPPAASIEIWRGPQRLTSLRLHDKETANVAVPNAEGGVALRILPQVDPKCATVEMTPQAP
jgi:hypothetical protein